MRVLISHHAKSDGKLAIKLSNGLRKTNGQPRIENLKAICGEENPRKISDELRKRYDGMIAVLSRPYMQDDWLVNELLQAILVEQNSRNTFVFPIVVSNCQILPPLKERVIDFRNREFDEAFAELCMLFEGSRDVFVVMRYGDPAHDHFYQLYVKPTIEEAGYSAIRIDEIKDAGSITDQILARIEASTIVYADLSGRRPNCYFETGYAIALGKDLILTKLKGEQVDFDLSHRRHIVYEYGHGREFALELRDHLEAIKRARTADTQDALTPRVGARKRSLTPNARRAS